MGLQHRSLGQIIIPPITGTPPPPEALKKPDCSPTRDTPPLPPKLSRGQQPQNSQSLSTSSKAPGWSEASRESIPGRLHRGSSWQGLCWGGSSHTVRNLRGQMRPVYGDTSPTVAPVLHQMGQSLPFPRGPVRRHSFSWIPTTAPKSPQSFDSAAISGAPTATSALCKIRGCGRGREMLSYPFPILPSTSCS